MKDNKRQAKTFGKAIRYFCLHCMGCSAREVKKCSATDCPLYPFRFGTNPNRKKKQISKEHLDKMNEARLKSENISENIQ
ncbi:MAG: hypothetical protein APR63_14300 [Desulfuromonas sp. SDB]|nr:MAG: hypothetical protein APR63_14300 [Desulfuromonas sp. SDB]